MRSLAFEFIQNQRQMEATRHVNPFLIRMEFA